MKTPKKDINQLLKTMSLEEKIGQTNMLGGSIYHDFSPEGQSALLMKGSIGSMMFLDPATNNELQKKQLSLSPNAIPIVFCCDNIHGVETLFPNPLGEAASFDPAMAKTTAGIVAQEERARGARWNFAPMVDIARDARWGRNVEGAGEDPLLASDFGVARVQGLQGSNGAIDSDHVAATVKHFAGYSLLEGGEEYQRVSVNERELEMYAYPSYFASIKAGASSVMLAFNDLEGVPCTANKDLIQGVLRQRLGFDGVVVSDYGAVKQLFDQHYSSSEKEAVYDAFSAGLDVDMESRLYIKYLKELIEEGRISVASLDAAVKRILLLKDKLGLFANPFAEADYSHRILTPEALQASEHAAIRSAVLLKNDGVLPLKPSSKIGFMGPYLDEAKMQNGPWSYDDSLKSSVTYLAALKASLPQASFLHEAAEAHGYDLVLYFGGNPREQAGESASLANLDLAPSQKEDLRALEKSGAKVVLVLTSSRPLSLSEEMAHCAAILDMWTPGTCGGSALVKLLLGLEEPTGHTPITFPRTAAQGPLYYNRIRSCRPYDPQNFYSCRYVDLASGPLVPFGFGLSYYPSRLSGLALKKTILALGEELEVRYRLENLSAHPIRRLAQFYLRKDFTRPLGPEEQLVAYQWSVLAPHETKEETIRIPLSRFASTEKEAGSYHLALGENSASFSAETAFVIR